MSVSRGECHEWLDWVLQWAEQFEATDPMKLAQLQGAIATCHMVIDQLAERNRPTSPL